MRIFENTVRDRQNAAAIYCGLNCISGKGRKRLKTIAQTLLALQAHPGAPVPDSICRDIMRNSEDEPLPVKGAFTGVCL